MRKAQLVLPVAAFASTLLTGLAMYVSFVAMDELDRLSRAYLATRYAPFPPQRVLSTPFAAYTSHDAEGALSLASTLVEWGRRTEQVEQSLSQPSPGQALALN